MKPYETTTVKDVVKKDLTVSLKSDTKHFWFLYILAGLSFSLHCYVLYEVHFSGPSRHPVFDNEIQERQRRDLVDSDVPEANVEFIHPKLRDDMPDNEDPDNPWVWLTSYSRVPVSFLTCFHFQLVTHVLFLCIPAPCHSGFLCCHQRILPARARRQEGRFGQARAARFKGQKGQKWQTRCQGSSGAYGPGRVDKLLFSRIFTLYLILFLL